MVCMALSCFFDLAPICLFVLDIGPAMCFLQIAILLFDMDQIAQAGRVDRAGQAGRAAPLRRRAARQGLTARRLSQAGCAPVALKSH